MLFYIQDAIQTTEGGMVPLRDESTASNLLRRLVGQRAAARLITAVGASAALRLSASDLVEIGGVDPKTAERATAARDYAHAVLTRRRIEASSSDAVLAALPQGLAFAEVEMLFALALDGRSGVKAVAMVAKGGASQTALTPRDVFLPLVRVGAMAFLLVHNHPSGSHLPSDADVIMTNMMARIGVRLGIQLLDHIIIAAEGSFSFQESGLLPTAGELESMLNEDAGLTAGGAS